MDNLYLAYYSTGAGCVLALLGWAVHVFTRPEKPTLLLRSDALFWRRVFAQCPILEEVYRPPFFWGRSGHIQSFIYAMYGRFNAPMPTGERKSAVLKDGATLTFDIFEAEKKENEAEKQEEDVTIIICGGIGNGSHSAYIRTLTTYARSRGYRMVVLNHLGANYSIPLTSPRMFCYGNTEELRVVVDFTFETYPNSKLILIGFSMGGNIALKFLGEFPEKQSRFLCAISVCQGYCAMSGYESLMNTWRHWRKLYMRFMARGVKRTLRRHQDVLFSKEAQERYGPIDVDAVFSARTLVDIDREFFTKMCGFKHVEDYYRWCSSVHYFDNITNIPVLLLNSKDDPIIQGKCQRIAHEFAQKSPLVCFVGTRHGGHLGFFENGWICPNDLSWLDRFIVQISDAVVAEDSRQQKIDTPTNGKLLLK